MGYPITLVAHKDSVKEDWLNEIRQYASDVVALAEHAADDLQLTDEPDISTSRAEPINVQPPKPEAARPSDSKLPEKRKEETAIKESESKKVKVEEGEDMSRYSSSRYSASSKLVEGKMPNKFKMIIQVESFFRNQASNSFDKFKIK